MNVFSIAFGGRHSSFLSALIDVFGYTGAFVFNFFGGSIAQHHGWPVFLGLLLTVAVLALVTLTVFLHLEHKSEKKQMEKSTRTTSVKTRPRGACPRHQRYCKQWGNLG